MISLAHVKSTQQVEASNARRIAWPGGKLTSNKEEALRKFMERKNGIKGTSNAAPAPVETPTKRPSQDVRRKHATPKKGTLFKKHHSIRKQQPVDVVKKSPKQAKKPLPTTAKLAMSLDDIVKKNK
ncbi:hypothetical protein AC1031_014681 [Aphanomyces cochlioides]|nr:hypothetical protein AC1031_014681 [Aphanomyces cochlioides]